MSALLHAHWRPGWNTVPVGLASVFVTIVLIQALRSAAATTLRLGYGLATLGLLASVLGMAVASATQDPLVAEQVYRLGQSLLPLAGFGAVLFLMTLTRSLDGARGRLIVAGLAALALIPLCALGPGVVDGVWRTPTGLYYFKLGPLASLQSLYAAGMCSGAVVHLYRRLRRETSIERRLRYKRALGASAIMLLGIVDLPLAYEIGLYPMVWLFSSIGALLLARVVMGVPPSMLEQRLPWLWLILVDLTVGAVGIGLLIHFGAPPLAMTTAVVALYALLRVILLFAGRSPRAVTPDDPMSVVAAELAAALRRARTAPAIAELTVAAIRRGLGAASAELLLDHAGVLVRADGSDAPEANRQRAAVDRIAPVGSGLVFRDDVSGTLGELQRREAVFDQLGAVALASLDGADRRLGLLVVGDLGGIAPVLAMRFLRAVSDDAGAALRYVASLEHAASRVEMAMELALAVEVQRAFVPPTDRVDLGRFSLCGDYRPATRCGGDWWSYERMAGDRVLLVIGDVTGHGLGSALVTAAAKGACDLGTQLMGEEVDLEKLFALLDTAVVRVGAGEYHMTCFIASIDQATGVVEFGNAGHVAPYLCRSHGERVELDALVARGNPLGSGRGSGPRLATRTLEPGDLVLWYTDGLVECTNTTGDRFGDRRMQRLLRGLAREPALEKIRDEIGATVAEFCGDQPLDDDITLVLGRFGGAPA